MMAGAACGARIVAANPETIGVAAEMIHAGAIVGYPTETLYGLAVDALSVEALELLLRTKGRRATQAIPVLVTDLDMARAVADVPPFAEQLAERHWPGALTLVLRALSHLPSPVVSARGGVGLRVSSDPVAAELVRRVGGPITATSANRSGEAAATRAAHAGLPGVALVLDDGERAQPPSTVLELIDGPRLLRQGAVRIDGL